MNRIMEWIERKTPAFEKFVANKFISAIRDGFAAPMYVILFSSVFMMVAFVPNIWGASWPDHIVDHLMRPYNFTMGFYGLFTTGTIARAMTIILNNDQERGKELDPLATMITSISAYLLLMADPVEGGISTQHMGAEGMLAGILIAFIVPHVFKFSIDRNLTIRLPKQVPPNISNAFRSLIAFSISMSIFWIFDIWFKNMSGGANLAQFLVNTLSPLFEMADTYLGLTLVFGASAFFQFLGLNGPSIALPAVKPAMFMNLAENQALYTAGKQPIHALIDTGYDMTAAFGGTGATFVIVLMFAFLSKSKANKAVGRAAVIPTMFNVNEPITFGAPLVLNPVFFIPFMLAPIVNTLLYKFFISGLGMGGVIHQLPWTTPGPIGLPLSTNLEPLSFLLTLIILVVDTMIYYPFFKVYDNMMLETEANVEEEVVIEEKTVDEKISDLGKRSDSIEVLVLCAGGGTSGLLANALNEAKDKYDVDIYAEATSFGTHNTMLKGKDLVILAPQASSYFERLQKETEGTKTKVRLTKGQQYIKLTQNPDLALEYVYEQLKDMN